MATHAARIIPGARVSTFARHFGLEWAEALFDKRWATARVKGTVQSAVGTGKWLVLWDGDGEPLESSRAHLRLVREDEVSVRLVRGCRSGAGAFPRAARHPHAQRAGCAVMPTRDCSTVCRLLYCCLAG